MTKKILVLDGHSGESTFCRALAIKAAQGAKDTGHDVRLMHMSQMPFDPILKDDQEQEPALKSFQENLTWCDHFVLVHPLWWGSPPAKLKGLFDRSLLPNFAYRYEEGKALPQKLLAGRSATVLVTCDTPSWYLRFVYGAGWQKIIKRQILGFCGFSPVRFLSIGPIHSSTLKKREKWLSQAHALGHATR